MPILSAIQQGFGRALADPKMLLVLWLLNTLAALPGALAVSEAIRTDLGASRFHVGLEEGFDMDWLAEYRHRNRSGIPALFEPAHTGGNLVRENLDAWFGGRVLAGNPALAALLVAFGLVWILVQGGVIARLVRRGERFRPGTFFADGGALFIRYLVLAALTGVVYVLLFRLAGWHFDALSDAFRDAGTEKALIVRVVLWGALFAALLHMVRMVADYAKIAIAVDGTRFVPAALWQGARFVVARPLRTLGVYAGVGIVTLVFLWLYSVVAPGPGQSTAFGVIVAFLFSQLFVAGRIFLRVALLGAEVETYQDAGGM